MILNPEKCQYMCLGKDSVSDLLRFCGEDLEASQLETVLGIQIDNKLDFENHIKSFRGKALPKTRDILKKIKFSSKQCL